MHAQTMISSKVPSVVYSTLVAATLVFQSTNLMAQVSRPASPVSAVSSASSGATESAEGSPGSTVLDFEPLLNEKTSTCTKQQRCRFAQQGDEIFWIWFDTVNYTEDNLREITGIHIKNDKNGEVQNFKLEDVARVATNEPFGFYKTQLRKDGPFDLVLYSMNSPHDGDLYFYFVFDPKSRKFLQGHEQIPRLARMADGKALVSKDDPDIVYDLDRKLKLNLRIPPASATTSEKKSEKKGESSEKSRPVTK